MTAPAAAVVAEELTTLLAASAEHAAGLKCVRISVRCLRTLLTVVGSGVLPGRDWIKIDELRELALIEIECHLIGVGWHEQSTPDKTIAHWLTGASMSDIADVLTATASRIALR